MKNYRNGKSWSGVIAVYLMVLAGVMTGIYYGTRLPLGTLTQYNAPASYQ